MDIAVHADRLEAVDVRMNLVARVRSVFTAFIVPSKEGCLLANDFSSTA
jgi:hypothetical protein